MIVGQPPMSLAEGSQLRVLLSPSPRNVLDHGGAAPQLLSVAPDCSSAVIAGLPQTQCSAPLLLQFLPSVDNFLKALPTED